MIRRSLVLALLTVAGVAGAQEAREEHDADPSARFEYWYHLRAFPHRKIPHGAYAAAKAYVRQHWGGGIASSPSTTSPGAPQWTALGPAPVTGEGSVPNSGRVSSIAVDPTNASIIYLGGADGGVWKTTNNGGTWTALTDAECSLSTGSVTVDPVTPSIVYVGTGEANNNGDAVEGCGILQSTNGGTTWSQVGAATFTSSGGPPPVAKLLIDQATAGSASSTTLLAATWFGGVWKSTNSGATWTQTLSAGATDLVQDPSNANTIYAAGTTAFSNDPTNGIYKSNDKGSTWTQLGGGLPTTNVGRINLAIAPSQPQTLYAAVQVALGSGSPSAGQFLGLWRTTNGGTTWTQQSATGANCGNQCWYNMVVMVDPTHPDTVYFSGLFVKRSFDGGQTFTDSSSKSYMHTDQHALVMSPSAAGTIYAGNDGGIWESNDYGATWSDINGNVSITQFYRGVAGLQTAGGLDVLGGSQDNGTNELLGAGPWSWVNGGDGGMTLIYYTTSTTAYSEVNWGNCGGTCGGPYKRTATSGGMQLAVNGITLADSAAFIPPLAMDPVTSTTLYFGTTRLYKTTNGASNWAPISNDLNSHPGYHIYSIAVAPSNTSTIYVGTDDGNLWVTTNGGSTYTPIGGTLPTAAVTSITIDPSNASHAWVTFSGFGNSHAFVTTTAGASWTDITYDLPNAPADAVAYIPSTGEVAVGTDVGVFRLEPGQTAWQQYAPGMPNVQVDALTYVPSAQVLLAGTHGRGLFSFALNPSAVLRGDVNGDGQVTAVDAQAILTYVVGLSLPVGYKPTPNGDVTCTGSTLSALDAQVVLSYIVGLPTPNFCVGAVR